MKKKVKKVIFPRKEFKATFLKERKRSFTEVFLAALADFYADDPTIPGISIAYLPKERAYYASIRRYDKDAKPNIVLTAQELSIAACIKDLALSWHTRKERSHDNMNALAARLGGRKKKGRK